MRMRKLTPFMDSAVPTEDMTTIFGMGCAAARIADRVFLAQMVMKSGGELGSGAEKGLSVSLRALRVTSTTSIAEGLEAIAFEMSASLAGEPREMLRPSRSLREPLFRTKAVT